jgi:hypothetical protein
VVGLSFFFEIIGRSQLAITRRVDRNDLVLISFVMMPEYQSCQKETEKEASP